MIKKCTFITQFNRDRSYIRDCNVVEFKEPSKVKESLSYVTDINTIYDNYCKSGKLPLNGNQPIYDENFINYDSLIEAQEAVREASQYFQTLPSDIRIQYGNDLGKFVQAIHSNDKFLIDKGVLKKKELNADSHVPSEGDKTLNTPTGVVTPRPINIKNVSDTKVPSQTSQSSDDSGTTS